MMTDLISYSMMKYVLLFRFDMGDGKTAIYDVDLENMKLSNDYRVY